MISDMKAAYVTSEAEFKNVVADQNADAILFATEEDALLAVKHECGVCAYYTSS